MEVEGWATAGGIELHGSRGFEEYGGCWNIPLNNQGIKEWWGSFRRDGEGEKG
jgi:hypothetical protein